MHIAKLNGHKRCLAFQARIFNVSLQIIAINLLILQAQAIPQHQQPLIQQNQLVAQPQDQLQAKTSQYQEPNLAPLNASNQTADLSLLINETLAINNKTLSNSDKTILKDDWTFDMIEYDLMEFLQDLSARYKQRNKTNNDGSSHYPENPSEGDSPLEAKGSGVDLAEMGDGVAKTSVTDALLKLPVNKPPAAVAQATAPAKFHPTSIPQLSTSLASGDSEIAESSWQYGIFDRFTRPRSTTRAPSIPTSDSMYLSEANGARLDVKNFNSDECGLRTYYQDENQALFYPEQIESLPDEMNQAAIKRLRLPTGPNERKKIPLPGSILDLIKDRGDGVDNAAIGDGIMPKPPPSLDQWESSLVDLEENKQEGSVINDGQKTTPTEGFADSEFNLNSRRHWLQQQLGNTLQMLGFNTTNQSVGDIFVNQSGSPYPVGGYFRENMMKMSDKWGKAADIDKASEQKLIARQDELKLEARVIGGSDARIGDSPWSVSLQALVSRPGTGGVEYRHYCGGTIISEYYILTAAHCLDFMVGRESRLFVVVGDINWRMSTSTLHGRRFGIEKLIIHSGYKSTAFGHDIGLIRTKESMKPLKLNGKYIINSVCLPQRGVEHSGEAELVGWGLFSNRNEMADSLQIADVPILPRPLCVDLYKRRTGLIQWLIGIELITEKQVCAGTFGRGICQGDSGSALVVNEKVSMHKQQLSSATLLRDRETRQSKATIIGIVAFGGIRRCSYQSLPGVYMQTSKYMDWILPRIQD